MFGIIAFIVGVAAGIAIAYSLLEKRLAEQKQSLERHHQRAIEDLERNHQFRLDRTVQDIQQQAANTPSTVDPQRAQTSRPESPEVTRNLADIKTLVAQESRIREVILAEREQYQARAQEAVQSLDQTPEPPEDPPIPYAEIAIPPSPPISEVELNANPEPPSPPETTAQPEREAVNLTPPQSESTEITPAEPEEAEMPAPAPEPAGNPTTPAVDMSNPTEIMRILGTWPKLSALPQILSYIRHSSPEVRSSVAASLGQLAASCPVTTEIERMIPSLGQLSQDISVQVRETAIDALGQIQSADVLPYLERALKDANPKVQKAASLALQRLKPMYQTSKAQSQKPISLWENRPEDS